MKAILINGKIKVYPQLPRRWKSTSGEVINGYRNLPDTIHYADG